MKFGNINLQGIGELQNANIQNLPSAPTTNLKKGRLYFDTTDNTLYVYDGTNWVNALSQGNYTFQNGIELVSGTRNVQFKIATGGNAGNVTFTADSNGVAGTVGDASTSAKGVIEIATDDEAETGTATDLAVTPYQLNQAEERAAHAAKYLLSIDQDSTDYLTYQDSYGYIGAKVDTVVGTVSTNLVTSGAVATAIANAQVGAMTYKGVWAATGQTDYSSITLPVKAGYMYIVSGSATIGGIEWNTDDYLVINADVAVGGTITDVKKIDNTEGSDIVRLNASQTLTNKTIDADDNTISDLTTSNFKSGTVVTSVGATGSDTAIPTEKAVRSAINGLTYAVQNSALTASGGKCIFTVTHNLNTTNPITSLYEVSTGEKVMYDVAITSANVVTYTILSASNIAADTYLAVVQK